MNEPSLIHGGKRGSPHPAWGPASGRGSGTAQLCYGRSRVRGRDGRWGSVLLVRLPGSHFAHEDSRWRTGEAIRVWEPSSSSLPTVTRDCCSNWDLDDLVKATCQHGENIDPRVHTDALYPSDPPSKQSFRFKSESQVLHLVVIGPGRALWGVRNSISESTRTLRERFVHSAKLGDARKSKWGC